MGDAMSTNSNCLYIEVKPGEWWYVLEDYNAPKNAWDWREHATARGPFSSEDAADEHLHMYNANPGGSCSCPYEDGYEPDEVMKRLMEEAPRERSY